MIINLDSFGFDFKNGFFWSVIIGREYSFRVFVCFLIFLRMFGDEKKFIMVIFIVMSTVFILFLYIGVMVLFILGGDKGLRLFMIVE